MQFITSSISTMLVLLLLGMVVFFVLSANNLSTFVRENIGFTILVSDDMKEAEALKFQKELNACPFVKESQYISKEQALKEQTEAMGLTIKPSSDHIGVQCVEYQTHEHYSYRHLALASHQEREDERPLEIVAQKSFIIDITN